MVRRSRLFSECVRRMPRGERARELGATERGAAACRRARFGAWAVERLMDANRVPPRTLPHPPLSPPLLRLITTIPTTVHCH